jgi:NOL1/NOP2/fmu family ribosome biogenesis protein
VTCAVITQETPDRLAARLAGFFDRVLVDAPCSGEGMFRKEPDACREWRPGQIAGCARRQLGILDAAARLVRPGGWLAYSTCTFALEENEAVIVGFLRRHRDFAVEPIERRPGFDAGLANRLGDASDAISRTVRIWPHHAPGEGHFVALLRRADDGMIASVSAPRIKKPSVRALAAYQTFCREHLGRVPADEVSLIGTELYAVPPAAPDLGGLRRARPGWWLGTVRGDRFEPGHALAMALIPDDVRSALNLTAGDPRVTAFLRGESLRSSGDDGWVLVAVDGFPLGWGKRLRGVVKNRRPRGLAIE